MKLAALVTCATAVIGIPLNDVSPQMTLIAAAQPFNLHRRADPPASDEVWARAQCKGGQFVKVFLMSDADAAKEYTPPQSSVQSRWTGDLKSELATWGWSEDKLIKSVCEFDELALGKGWVNAAKQLGIGTEGWKDIWCYRFSHGTAWNVMANKKYNVNGREYPFTGAYAQFAVNAQSGAILAMDNLMPGSAIKKNSQRDPQPGELPELRSLSDMLWGGWYRGSQPEDPETPKNLNVANIKYLISVQITNAETLSIIQRALSEIKKDSVSMWPGDTFGLDTGGGKALLGSPNGKRWGYLLNQRKKEAGIKKIDRVTVFKGREQSNPMMVFHVG